MPVITKKIEKHISIGYECYYCGKEIQKTDELFINKENLKENMNRVDQIKNMLGAIMMHTTITKRTVSTFEMSIP